tara:strand:+ start:9495 stop:9794 length:300 start_codon:yes stop_codon:yes gene_type:complete
MRYDRPYKKERRKESGRSTRRDEETEKTETLKYKLCEAVVSSSGFNTNDKLPYVTIDHKDERCDRARAQRCHRRRRRRRRRRRAFAFRAWRGTGKEESP